MKTSNNDLMFAELLNAINMVVHRRFPTLEPNVMAKMTLAADLVLNVYLRGQEDERLKQLNH